MSMHNEEMTASEFLAWYKENAAEIKEEKRIAEIIRKRNIKLAAEAERIKHDIELMTKQFREALHAGGIHYSGELIADGEEHHFYVDDDEPGGLNWGYRLQYRHRNVFMRRRAGMSGRFWECGLGGQSWDYQGSKKSNKKMLARIKGNMEYRRKQKGAAG